MIDINIAEIPPSGFVLANFKGKTVFEPYKMIDGHLVFKGKELLKEEELIVCHFFDENNEYRLIARESRNDIVKRLFSSAEEESMDPDLLFAEDVLVKKEYAERPELPEKLHIVNRYKYSENDTLVLDNYRIGVCRSAT